MPLRSQEFTIPYSTFDLLHDIPDMENHTFCSQNIPPTLSEPSVIHFLQNCLFTVLNHFIFFLKLLSVCHFLCSMKTFPCHSMTLIIKLPYSLTIIKILLKHNPWINSLNRICLSTTFGFLIQVNNKDSRKAKTNTATANTVEPDGV